MNVLPEFDRRPASLADRAATFTTVFEEMIPAFAAITTIEQVRDNVRVLIDFQGHAVDWKEFKDDCTVERLSRLPWDEMTKLRDQNDRCEKAINTLSDEVARIRRLIRR